MSQSITEWQFASRWRVWLFVLILVVATIFAYRPAWHGGFLWDDDAYVTNNELLTAPDGLRRIWFSLDSPSQYFPLVYTTFRFEHALWGLNPSGYHLVNIALHVANALLVWWLLARLNVPGAWLAGAVFALHPVQVESVAWITERKNVLMGFFFLLTLIAWTVFLDERTNRSWRFYGLALGLYGLALSAKTTACTLPAALLLILWLRKRRISRTEILQIVPFFLLGLGMGLVTIWWERYHQGTGRSLFAFLSPTERILVASRAIWFYFGKLIWPSNLTFIYPRWTISVANPFAYAWLLAAGGLCALIYFTRRYAGRGVEVAGLFFVATLSPVLGFIMLYTFRYTFVADHYQYLACVGPIALACAGLVILTNAWGSHGRRLMLGTAVCVVVALGVLTWRQSAMYADIEGLWRTTLARNPGCWMAHNNLGIVLYQKGEIDEAISHYRATLKMQPDFWDADYNLGTALLKKGEVDDALIHCNRAVIGQPNDPDTQVALANALSQKGLIEDAIVHYQRACAVRPNYVSAHYNLSNLFLQKGELDKAISNSRAVLSIQPEHAEARINLAVALDEKGQIADAITNYKKVLAISPLSVPAQNNLAWILATCSDRSSRDGIKALELARQANRLSGGANPVVRRTLAAAYAEIGQFTEAIGTAKEASRIAEAQGDNALTAQLQKEIAIYQTGLPYRETQK
jgi:tetratricopeptide (TPR) repeat protein